MKRIYKLILTLGIAYLMCFSNFACLSIDAYEPIMEYKFKVEEQKVKRAEFVWRTCIEKLRQEKVITNDQAININTYISKKIRTSKYEAKSNFYKTQKDALKIKNVDKIVSEKIITTTQGEMLKKELGKYNLTNLDY